MGAIVLNTLSFLNRLIAIIFTVCYAYQILYSPIVWLFCKKRASSDPVPLHRFAALICARNEAAVIGDLIDSLKAQIYSQEFLSMFVIADNCTDETADIAILHGAKVYTRYNTNLIGKGYALEELKKRICKDYPEGFDGFLFLMRTIFWSAITSSR